MEQNDKKKPGPVPGLPLAKVTVSLYPHLLEFGKNQPGGLSATMRRLLQKEADESGGKRP